MGKSERRDDDEGGKRGRMVRWTDNTDTKVPKK